MNTSKSVLDYCQEHTQAFLKRAQELQKIDEQKLRWKQDQESWSVLECFEHLNLYAEFYNPALSKAIDTSTQTSILPFKSGILGSYFAKSMLPNASMNKMKTFKDKNPVFAFTPSTSIDKFIKQQLVFSMLIDRARNIDINKAKTPITLTKLVRLKLGDTLLFMVNHNLRHFAQIERCLEKNN